MGIRQRHRLCHPIGPQAAKDPEEASRPRSLFRLLRRHLQDWGLVEEAQGHGLSRSNAARQVDLLTVASGVRRGKE